ncbi:MAG: tetratricopeptide repeat protein [Spirochaetales bacterium]|nr:tetratricopeptide repeat protein [Spirochaetales bacterium]
MRREKYAFYTTKKKKKGLRLVLLAALIAAVIGVLIFVVPYDKIYAIFAGQDKDKSLNELWDLKNYSEIIEITGEILKTSPFDSYYLGYLGLSLFYQASSDIENNKDLLDRTIFVLRKAKLDKSSAFIRSYSNEINYILALSYSFMGNYYIDLAIKYMEESLQQGYLGPDTYKLLATSYGELGDYNKKLDYLLLDLEIDETDIGLLALGQAYFELNRLQDAELATQKALNKTVNEKTMLECRFRLGEIFMQRNEFFKAEEQFKKILELNPRLADAHYNLGEIYSKMNDDIKARYHWREALKIDPNHYGATLRYYK